jgi:hypothetical protein
VSRAEWVAATQLITIKVVTKMQGLGLGLGMGAPIGEGGESWDFRAADLIGGVRAGGLGVYGPSYEISLGLTLQLYSMLCRFKTH